MGWTGITEPDHLNNVLNDRLADRLATDCKLIRPSLDRLLNSPPAHRTKAAPCWIGAPGHYDKLYVGVLLIDIDSILTPKLKPTPGQVVVQNREKFVSNTVRTARVWLTTDVSLAEGPDVRDYHERFAPYADDHLASG